MARLDWDKHRTRVWKSAGFGYKPPKPQSALGRARQRVAILYEDLQRARAADRPIKQRRLAAARTELLIEWRKVHRSG